jgi:hypothetical protein
MVLESTMSAEPTRVTFRVGTQTRPFSEPLLAFEVAQQLLADQGVGARLARVGLGLGAGPHHNAAGAGPQSLISRCTLLCGLRHTPYEREISPPSAA